MDKKVVCFTRARLYTEMLFVETIIPVSSNQKSSEGLAMPNDDASRLNYKLLFCLFFKRAVSLDDFSTYYFGSIKVNLRWNGG
mmetsp:Transcript_28528/g.39391  ORF Transcript_28528/g.39391 Transcript_28528/m.39391 type:complete len:83 (-) Transcript_28528:836-1084(-)